MSKAFKCNVCKERFDPMLVDDTNEFCTIEGFYFQNADLYEAHESSYREDNHIHLCPVCARFFSMMLDGQINTHKYINQIDHPKEKEEAYVYGFREGYEEGRKDREQEFSEMAAKAIIDILGGAAEKALQPDIPNRCCCDCDDSNLGKSEPRRCCGVPESDSKTPERKKRAQKVRE